MNSIPALLQVTDIGKNFSKRGWFFSRENITAIDSVNFTLNRGETLAIVGEAGSGKSTLAKILAGVVEPSHGEISVEGQPLSFGDYERRCKLIRMIFQDPNSSLNPRLRIGRILEAPLMLNTDMSAAERAYKVQETLRLVGLLPEHALFYPQMISAGQKQRVALARAVIMSPKIIVADESFSNLDLSVRSQIINLLLKLQAELGISYVIVANDLGLVRHISDRVIIMDQGKMIESGQTKEVFANPQHEITKRLLQSYIHEYLRA